MWWDGMRGSLKRDWLLLLLCCLLARSTWKGLAAEETQGITERIPPKLPLHFSGLIQVVAHQVDQTQEYPPWRKRMRINYDYPGKRAKVQIIEGHDTGKTFLRRYDDKNEYMVKTGQYPECQRAYLGEVMPLPEFPEDLTYKDLEEVNGFECEHWVQETPESRVHVYKALNNLNVPIRLVEESLLNDEVTPLLTYDFLELTTAEQNDSNFMIPDGYDRKSCKRNVAGFPYVHAFHHYLRF